MLYLADIVCTLCFCSKGDYDSAIAQYIRTIGKLEPSYVIRKVSSCSVCVYVYHVHMYVQCQLFCSFWMLKESTT